MDLRLVLVLLTAHFIGDFPLQSRVPGDLGVKKSKSNTALFEHVCIYTTTVAICVAALAPTWLALAYFTVVTAVLHFATDYVTSRLTSKYWFAYAIHDTLYVDPAKRANFFDTIGFDQLIHAWCLILTALVVFG